MSDGSEGRTILLHELEPDAQATIAELAAELHLTRVTFAAGDAQPRPDLAVLSPRKDEAASFRLAAVLAAGGSQVLVIGRKDPDLILRALRAGACEFVVAGDADDLRRAVRQRVSAPEVAARGTVVALFAAKGGSGATTLATNLAAALGQRDERVCLLDVDPNLGDVLSALDLPAGYTLSDLLANARRLDRDLLDASVQRHASGVAVIAPGEDVEAAARIGPEGLASALAFLRGHYAHVVVDGLHGFGELTLAGLDASDLIVLVVTQEVTAVRDARRCVDLFRRLGYGEEKLRVALNRFRRQSRITPDVVAEAVGLPVAVTVANDWRAASAAVERGEVVVTAAPRTQLARDVASLAALVAPERSPAPARSIFGRLFRRKAGGDGA